MASRTEGDSPLTEWSEAIAVSDQRNKEAVLIDLEARYVTLEKERDRLYEKAQVESERAAALEKKASDLQHEMTTVESSKVDIVRECQTEKDKASMAETQNKLHQERLTRLEEEGDNLREEISRLTKANKDLSGNLVESETKARLNDSAAIPLHYEVERLQKELDYMGSHVTWMEQELASRNDAIVTLKLDHSSELIKLRDSLDQANADRDEHESRISQLERSNRDYLSKTEKLASELHSCRLEAIAATETAEKELMAERRLVEMQKEQLDRSESRYARLERELDSLRALATQASEEAQHQVNELRTEIEADSRQVLIDQHTAHQNETDTLKKQIDDAHRARDIAEDRLLESPMTRFFPQTGDDEPMSLTDLYAKLNTMEDDLSNERTKRKKAELIYKRIHADIAAKTPLLQRQRQEHEWALEQLSNVQGRLHDSLQELAAVRKEAEESGLTRSRLELERNILKLQTKELATQVQALLTSQCGGAVPDGIPLSLKDIQNQNVTLIGEHARLTLAIEELEGKLRNDRTAALLAQTETEVKSLRDERQRQEILVAGIVQQRDLYRALLAKHGESIGGVTTTELIVAQHSEETKAVEDRNMNLEHDLATAQAEIVLLRNDRDSLEERIGRYDAHISELTTSMYKSQNELTSALSAVARSQTEGSYFRDKCVRMEETLESTRAELQKIQEGRKELQTINARLQQSLASASAEVTKLESQARDAERKQRLAEIQGQAARAAEIRLNSDLSQVRSELTRQGNLVEAVRKIEAGLTARNDEEKDKLKEARDHFSDMLGTERSKHAVEIEAMLNQIRELEVDIKSALSKKDDALAEVTSARKEALSSATAMQELSAKCANLEAKLEATINTWGDGAMNDEKGTLAARHEEIAMELERTKVDLAAANSRVLEFQKLAKNSESALVDLTKTTEEFKQTYAAELREFTMRIDDLKKENQAKQDIIVELTNDLMKRRSEQESEIEFLRNQIVGLTNDVDNAHKDAESARLRESSITIEMEKYKSEFNRAQSNYERELNLHAAARTEVRMANENLMMEQNQRRLAEENEERVKADIAAKEKIAEGEKNVMQASIEELEKLLSETRGHSEVLHKQLATLAEEVETRQTARIQAAAGVDEPTTVVAEANKSQKTISELREIVRYMRSEHELIQAQLDAARRTAVREQAATAVVRRTLDEARAEIKVLQDERTMFIDTNISEDQTEKLKHADMQLTLLRESNQLLREETTKLNDSFKMKETELQDMMTKLEPSENLRRDLQIEKAALDAENISLKRELDTWKGRLQCMISKFNTIDPEEHKAVVSEAEHLRKEIANLNSQVSTAEKEKTAAKSAIAKLNKDLSHQKALVEEQVAMLVKVKAERDSAVKSTSASLETAKELDQLKERIQKMDSDAKSDKTELDGALQRNDALKKRMRQYQDTINKQTAKLAELEKALATPSPQPTKEQDTKPMVQTLATGATKPPSAERVVGMEAVTEKAQDVMKETSSRAKEERPTLPEGGFKFGPGGKRPPLENKTSESSTLSITFGAKAPKVQEKTEVDNAPKLGSVPSNSAGQSPMLSPPRSCSPLQDKNDVLSGGNDSEATKKKALIARLNEKKRKLAEAKAQKQAQLAKSPGDTGVTDEKPDEPVKQHLEVETVTEPRVDSTVPVVTMKQKPKDKEEQIESEGKAEPEPGATKRKAGDASKLVSIVEEPVAKKVKGTDLRSESAGSSKNSTQEQAAVEETKCMPPTLQGNALETVPPGEGGSLTSVSATFIGNSGESFTFGSSASIQPASDFSNLRATEASAPSSVFLTDMKPPSSSPAPFIFGEKRSITLPTPTNPQPIPANPFGAFSSPFGPTQAMPLFGNSSGIKRSTPDDEYCEGEDTKHSRLDDAIDEAVEDGVKSNADVKPE